MFWPDRCTGGMCDGSSHQLSSTKSSAYGLGAVCRGGGGVLMSTFSSTDDVAVEASESRRSRPTGSAGISSWVPWAVRLGRLTALLRCRPWAPRLRFDAADRASRTRYKLTDAAATAVMIASVILGLARAEAGELEISMLGDVISCWRQSARRPLVALPSFQAYQNREF